MKTLHCCMIVLALLAAMAVALPVTDAGAGCPVKAENDKKRALKEEAKLKTMLATLVVADNDGLGQVELTDPGTVTAIAPGTGGLSKPRPWSAAEKARFDKAKVNSALPAPKGVW